ncbi:MAG: HAD hydrolase family protein [Deltaproteobacteria bacterium]|nr:HAD hydrolase family protein [Deltaproteobacteria bacterium]
MPYDFTEAIERAKKIKMVVLDVHGVLTTGVVLYNEDGMKFQAFCHDDGFGANCLMMLGIDVALMTRKSKIVEVRAAEVGIKRVIQAKDKITKLQEVAGELGIGFDEICFVGDEIIDMGVMKQVGFAVSPANGVPEVQEVSHLVTQRAGGQGVLRELAEFILRAQGKWQGLVDKVSSKGWG